MRFVLLPSYEEFNIQQPYFILVHAFQSRKRALRRNLGLNVFRKDLYAIVPKRSDLLCIKELGLIYNELH